MKEFLKGIVGMVKGDDNGACVSNYTIQMGDDMIGKEYYTNVPGDGHCLFYALALALNKTKEQVLAALVQELTQNAPRYANAMYVDTVSEDQYGIIEAIKQEVQRVLDKNLNPGVLWEQAAANVFNVQINIARFNEDNSPSYSTSGDHYISTISPYRITDSTQDITLAIRGQHEHGQNMHYLAQGQYPEAQVAQIWTEAQMGSEAMIAASSSLYGDCQAVLPISRGSLGSEEEQLQRALALSQSEAAIKAASTAQETRDEQIARALAEEGGVAQRLDALPAEEQKGVWDVLSAWGAAIMGSSNDDKEMEAAIALSKADAERIAQEAIDAQMARALAEEEEGAAWMPEVQHQLRGYNNASSIPELAQEDTSKDAEIAALLAQGLNIGYSR